MLTEPGGLVWTEVTIPSDDPLWERDVGRAPLWLGTAWSKALGASGVSGSSVHQGAMRRTHWSAKVCFAGTAPGEVILRDRKVVGISQSRRRGGARFECAALLDWEPKRLLDVLNLEGSGSRAALDALSDVAVALGPLLEADQLQASLLDHLP